jgi:predicted 3-demethylubiquinone-9 3-methyltransferase (glyoxalase superfamily)
MFKGKAEDAMTFYVSRFSGSEIVSIRQVWRMTAEL